MDDRSRNGMVVSFGQRTAPDVEKVSYWEYPFYHVDVESEVPTARSTAKTHSCSNRKGELARIHVDDLRNRQYGIGKQKKYIFLNYSVWMQIIPEYDFFSYSSIYYC